MIKVVRIAGEAFDLETGERASKALVLSNGMDEVHVPVRDDIINAVLHLAYKSRTTPLQEKEAVEEEEPLAQPELISERDEYGDPRSGTASI